MACELWVRGEAENTGHVQVDVLVVAGWSRNRPMPTLTVINVNQSLGYTQYSANPPWQYDAGGWYSSPDFYLKNCTDEEPCDCVNGGCVPKTTYNTPGVFASLAACQSGCAQNSTCTGECVDPAEIAGLRQALNNLQSKFCR
jgi:hypothetical protein